MPIWICRFFQLAPDAANSKVYTIDKEVEVISDDLIQDESSNKHQQISSGIQIVFYGVQVSDMSNGCLFEVVFDIVCLWARPENFDSPNSPNHRGGPSPSPRCSDLRHRPEGQETNKQQ